MSGARLVRSAIKAASSELAESIGEQLASPHHRFRIVHAEDLLESERNAIWMIFESNMRAFYTSSSFGWDPRAKWKELFNSLSRFYLAYQAAASELIGFAMFRFEYEDQESVLYCYDLQVTRIFQGTGLGKTLMRQLAKIGSAWKMEKVMLTVFKANTRAFQFYNSTGFVVDSCSPSCAEDGSDVDYEILSMRLT
ncbi:uncharacterized protein LACBIDRAFT_300721 [Laccaria bicolor S238N-H82]|uniref:N-alpha-acetyltransferase 40 n=1 Tax=Laccaria bicolor (strain S238N-H82 / ATCC MYA-4686) TaxID=486041 RepID=B0CQ64_LACBS|nr:uncharacterized protein LACBIDRAFT_300721 [Laccaria bicolor S238N-H82]EDR15621.1 predicted protein [Laccaria bicolor S238N-H82]|eukprot:XP_001873829.1 predicted protein [Laccaria bicolor S238N-H82]